MLARFRGIVQKGTMQGRVLIIASLLASLPVLAMGTIAYWVASDNVKKEIAEANNLMMSQIQQRIDEKLITIENMTLQNAINPTFQRFLTSQNPKDEDEIFGLTMTILSSMQFLIDDVDSVYLYRPDNKLVVSANLGMTDDSVLPDYVKEAAVGTLNKAWIDHKLESSVYRDVLHQITFIRKIDGPDRSYPGYLIVNMDETTLFSIFSSMNLGENRELLIVTPSSNVFTDMSNDMLQLPMEEDSFIRGIMDSTESEFTSTLRIDGRQTLLNYLKSPHNDWKYVTVVPYSDITKRLKAIQQTTLAICLLLILLSAFTSGILSKRWFRTLQSIIEAIKKKMEFPNTTFKNNEFFLIQNYFQSLEHSKERLEKQIEDSMPILKNNFIQKLLTDPYSADWKKQATYYGVPDRYDYYTVICIELDNTRGQTEQDRNLFYYAVMNIGREMVSHRANGQLVQMNSGHIAILLNHKERLSSDVQSAAVFHIAEDIRSIAESLLNITVTIGIGHDYEGLAHVRRSFSEAMEALSYQLVHGSGKVIYIGHVKLECSSLQYPYEYEQQILTNLKLANLAKIQDLLDDFTQSFMSESINYDQVRRTFTQLLAASERTMLELDANSANIHGYNLYYRLAELNTKEKIVHWLKIEVYPLMTEYIRNRLDQRTHSTIQKALDYIHEHYDTDLSLPMIADYISVPVSHFGHMFKVEVGMTFSDYILAYRMERAMQLLVSTDMRVSDIAERLRYNNSQNFIRVFKKMNSVTPGEYRARHSRLGGTI